MDIISFSKAVRALKTIGKLPELLTDNKDTTVEAINELVTTKQGLFITREVNHFVDSNSEESFWMEASSYGYIKGIKVTGSELTGDFIVTIHDKLPVEGGRIVYYSALITNILWDIMTIPFSDVSGSDSMYVTIDNQGIATNFNVQIYIAKP